MSETTSMQEENYIAYHILRYASDLVRDEWVNIGVLVFDPNSGQRRMRLIEEESEFARIRKLQPSADQRVLRQLRDHLESRFDAFLESLPFAESASFRTELEKFLNKWDGALSTGLQLSSPKGVQAADLDEELERLYKERVALQRSAVRVGSPGSRASIRSYCSQVWKQAKLWEKLEKSVRVSDYTFPGDPMRLDYSYRHNGTRGFVQALSVSRAPADAKLLAYTVQRMAARAPFKSEFAAVTDIALQPEIDRHRFVRDTLRDARIEPVPMEGFATWVAKLKPMLQ